MEAVTILRELWRRRVFVGVAALVAILVGLTLTYTPSLPPESRKYEVGVATARILVDTPESQVIEIAPKGSETLGARANLLANLMIEGDVKDSIAATVGLSPRKLIAGTESVGELPEAVADATSDPRAHTLVTRLVPNPSGEPLPIIEVEAQAPAAGEAADLAAAAVNGLDEYLDSKAAVDQVPDARRLEVAALGAPQAREDERGPRRMIALAAALFVFLVGCALTIATSKLVLAWRDASLEEGGSGVDERGARPDSAVVGETVDWSGDDDPAAARRPGKPRSLLRRRPGATVRANGDRKAAGEHSEAGAKSG